MEDDDEQPVKLFEFKKPMELFASKKMVKICAPMVRYTKYCNYIKNKTVLSNRYL